MCVDPGRFLWGVAVWKPVERILKERCLSEGEKCGGNFPHGKGLEQRWLKVFRDFMVHWCRRRGLLNLG